VVLGDQYRYHVDATLACIPFFTCGGIALLQGPPGAGVDDIRGAVYWTPASTDLNRTVAFSITTSADLCGDRARQSWNVTVVAPPLAVVFFTGSGAQSGMSSVPTNSDIVATFSRPVQPGTVTATSFLVSQTATGTPVIGTIAFHSEFSVGFVPSAPLLPSTSYTATITSSITDTDGNALATPGSWSFTTAPLPDTTPPAVAAVSPPQGGSCAPIDGLVRATFSESITLPTANPFSVVDSGSNSVAGVFSPLVLGSPPAQLVFSPNAVLNPGSSYTVTISNSVRDVVGNQMPSSFQWTFATTPGGVGTWSPISMVGAPLVSAQSSEIVWTGDEMIVWGRAGADTVVAGRYRPGSDSWSSMSSVGSPSARDGHVMLWTGDRMLVWGGWRQTGQERNDGGRYDPATDTWTAISTAGAPLGARLSAAVWTGTEMLVFGGLRGGAAINSHNGRYNPAMNTWSPISAAGAPQVRFGHTAIWTGGKMVVWGGNLGSFLYCTGGFGGICTNTGAAYDPSTNTWTSISAAGAPSPRQGHSAIWTGSRMIVWGGRNGDLLLNDGGIYDPSTDSWLPLSGTCAPSERYEHPAVWTGAEMLIAGSGRPFTGGIYDPATDMWRHLSLSNAPPGVFYEKVVWTGTQALIWAGQPQSYRYQP